MPNAREVLDKLVKDFELGIITNGFDDTQNIKLKYSEIDHFFKWVVTSESSGHRKREPTGGPSPPNRGAKTKGGQPQTPTERQHENQRRGRPPQPKPEASGPPNRAQAPREADRRAGTEEAEGVSPRNPGARDQQSRKIPEGGRLFIAESSHARMGNES